MSPEFGCALAFMTGIMGGLHCLGMCGGMAGGYFAGYGWQSKLLPHFTYHTARIVTYTLLGVGGALLGRTLIQTGIIGKGQGLMMIAAGGVVVVIGLWLWGLLPGSKSKHHRDCSTSPCDGRSNGCSRWQESLPLLAGTLNGLIPCSLLFSVAIKAAASSDPLYAAGVMLCFGLGTMPAMLLATTTGAIIGEYARGMLSRLTGLLVVLLGLWTIYEGVVFYDIMRGLAN